MKENAAYWIDHLGLIPHAEGGWYKELWRSDFLIPNSALPPGYNGDRSACTMIHYLLEGAHATAVAQQSAWHKVRSAEIWLWHAGGTLELHLGGSGDHPAPPEIHLLGENPGENFQAVVPPGVWQSARIHQGPYVLVSCIVSPGFHWEDFTLSE
jgi:predicted cupin superfamily sugar epimerase